MVAAFGLAAPALAAQCSVPCEAEFINGCVPFHCSRGKSLDASITQCTIEIADGVPQLANTGCVPGCTHTGPMQDATCSAISGGGSDGPAPPSGGGGTSQQREFGTLDASIGSVYVNGDSGCHVPMAGFAALAEELSTLVVVNCQSGATTRDILEKQITCSMVETCSTQILMTGMNGDGGDSSDPDFKYYDLVLQQALDTGKLVILLGHPHPRNGLVTGWVAFMAYHEAQASANVNVYFIDTRSMPNAATDSGACSADCALNYHTDNSHPSQHFVQTFVTQEIGKIAVGLYSDGGVGDGDGRGGVDHDNHGKDEQGHEHGDEEEDGHGDEHNNADEHEHNNGDRGEHGDEDEHQQEHGDEEEDVVPPGSGSGDSENGPDNSGSDAMPMVFPVFVSFMSLWFLAMI